MMDSVNACRPTDSVLYLVALISWQPGDGTRHSRNKQRSISGTAVGAEGSPGKFGSVRDGAMVRDVQIEC